MKRKVEKKKEQDEHKYSRRKKETLSKLWKCMTKEKNNEDERSRRKENGGTEEWKGRLSSQTWKKVEREMREMVDW